MKTLRTIIAGIAMVIAMVAAPRSSAQTVTPEMKKMVVAEMQKMLPMEVTPGMTWTKFTLNPECTVMSWTFKLDPKKLGTTLQEAKDEMNGYSNSDIKALLGDEVTEVLDMMQCNCNIIFTFPDGTSKKYTIKR